MPQVEPLSVVLADVARAMFNAPTVEEALSEVVRSAPRAVVGCDGAAIVIVRGDHFEVAASSSEVAAQAEQAEVEFGEGPCLESFRDHAVIVSDDLRFEERWPAWSAKTTELGFRSLLGFRLFVGEDSLGALNLYSTKAGSIDDEAQAAGLALAAHASIAMANAMRHDDDVAHVSRLENALARRDVIGQAKGILMERYHLTANAAFDRLRRLSQDSNRKLRDIASYVAETGELPEGLECGSDAGTPPAPLDKSQT